PFRLHTSHPQLLGVEACSTVFAASGLAVCAFRSDGSVSSSTSDAVRRSRAPPLRRGGRFRRRSRRRWRNTPPKQSWDRVVRTQRRTEDRILGRPAVRRSGRVSSAEAPRPLFGSRATVEAPVLFWQGAVVDAVRRVRWKARDR